MPSMKIGSYFGYSHSGENNNSHSSKTAKTSIQSENSTMFGFWGGMFGRAPKIEKYSPENLR